MCSFVNNWPFFQNILSGQLPKGEPLALADAGVFKVFHRSDALPVTQPPMSKPLQSK